jgi:hypothetical protein
MDAMKLGDKQELFSRLLPSLYLKAFELGFEIRTGDAFRDARVHGAPGVRVGYGSANSCHKLKLAIDLNLRRRDEAAMVTKTEDHKELGDWWELQHPLCRWGGRFNDGNHYSLTHDGCM